MIRVFIADDHEVVRRGVRELLATAGDLLVVGEGATAAEVLEAAPTGDWDLLILDLSLPGVTGLELLRRLHQTYPVLKIVVFSMYAAEQYAYRALQAGAAAYLPKDKPLTSLLEAIRDVVAGQATAAPLAVHPIGALPHAALTAREYQVFTLILHGRATSDIASDLGLNSSTVSNHIASIKTKLGVRTTSDIVSYGHRAGLIS